MEVNRYDNGTPNGTIKINTSSTKANDIVSSINEAILFLKTNRNIPDNLKISQNTNVKIMATPKPGMFDFFSKPNPVDLTQLSQEELAKLSLEPTIHVYFSQAGGRRRKTYKSRKSRKRR